MQDHFGEYMMFLDKQEAEAEMEKVDEFEDHFENLLIDIRLSITKLESEEKPTLDESLAQLASKWDTTMADLNNLLSPSHTRQFCIAKMPDGSKFTLPNRLRLSHRQRQFIRGCVTFFLLSCLLSIILFIIFF